MREGGVYPILASCMIIPPPTLATVKNKAILCAIVSYSLHIICVGKPLFLAMIMLFISCFFLLKSLTDKVLILFIKYLQTAILCSIGWVGV